MTSIKNALFIINKYSGGKYRPEVEGRIISACKDLGIECSIEFTQSRGHAIELARNAAASKMNVVFAVGGDGTVNEVAQGLVGSSTPMGILPKGSGNGLARHLGIPVDFKKALLVLKNHSIIRMDTMLVNENLSVNVSGIGFDGHIANLFANKANRGLIGYAQLTLKEFFSFSEFSSSILIDEEKVDMGKSFIIALANSSQFGNNARISPRASVMDEFFDVCLVKKVPLSQAAGFAAKMFTGNLDKSALVKIQKAKKITIDLEQPVSFHVDGEAMGASSHFEIEIQPASLYVMVPSENGRKSKYPI
jgi:YegS/Rv2252/BmrU family lipid kinase